jgi:PadR family transcriptional regulator PadR
MQISAYYALVRRKPGTLVPLEVAICTAAAALRRQGVNEFHGYEIAKTLGDAADTRLLTAYGTLYRALGRLEKMALVESRWEDPAVPARENRPGRRLYTLTALGEAAVDEARRADVDALARRPRRRLAPA